MTVERVKFDHVSFGVHDAVAALRDLRADFGAIPITGEQSPQFRYVISHIGTAPGVLVELMDATNRPEGFLQRFLDRTDDGPHHLTFEVPDIERCLALLAEHGVPVIQVKTDYPPWQEAFIHPDEAPGILIQIAASTCGYPSVRELLDGVTVPADQMPHTADGTDRLWWATTDPQPEPRVDGNVCGVGLSVADFSRADAIFVNTLGAESDSLDADTKRYTWDGLFVEARRGADIGLHSVYLNAKRSDDEPARQVAGIPFVHHPGH